VNKLKASLEQTLLWTSFLAMTLKIDQEEVFEGEGIREVEVSTKAIVCPEQGLKETLAAFFQGLESLCQVRGATVGYLAESLQQHLHLSEEDAEHIVDLLGGDLSAYIKKEAFVECALGWWESKTNEQENEVTEELVKEDSLGEERFQNQPDRSRVRRSSLENLEDLHFLEEEKMDLEERLRFSGEQEEKWRRQYFAKAAQCDLEEARRMETEEKRLEVEKRCTELAIQLEKAREEGEKKILENEVEMLLLRREEKLKDGRKEDFEENFAWTTETNLAPDEGERETPVSVGNLDLDQSLASELSCTRNGGSQLDHSLNSSQDVASQTDLFASELEGLKQAMVDNSPEGKHFFAIEEDDCLLDVPLEEDGEEEVVGDYNRLGSGVQDEAVGETERSIEEELQSSVLQVRGFQQQKTMETVLREEKASSPLCGKSKIIGREMLAYEVESNSTFEKEASMSKLSSEDCDVEKEVSKKSFAGFVKSILAWLLLLLTLFTTFGAVRVDHKVHLPSTWLLLYHLFGSSLPLPIISVAFDSNPRPHIN